MRVAYKDTDVRIPVTLDKTMATDDNLGGIMKFGADNLYPQTIENIISSSLTASACAIIYARFLTGMGFVDEQINKTIIGRDQRGKDVTVLQLLRQVASSLSRNNGFYIHVNKDADNKVKNASIVPFKYCRFNKVDEQGFSSKIGVYDNWEKRSDKKFKKEDIRFYDNFTTDLNSFASQVKKAGGPEKYRGQIYLYFNNPDYLYPLSPIDPVYLDCDTESQIQIFRNSEIRHGFQAKVVVRIPDPGEGSENEETIKNEIKGMTGADGKRTVILFDDIDENNNEVKSNGAFKIDQIPTTINDKLFESWVSETSNSIRKAFNGLPAVLIDYEQGKLSGTSGEAIAKAAEYYNAVTLDDRAALSQCFKDIFSHSVFDNLVSVSDWSIQPLELGAKAQTVDEALEKKLQSQATLKGSVGGVTALLELQKSISLGTTDLTSGIEIVKEIYGISEEVAQKMLGTPKIAPTTDGNTNI